jgi:NADH:ubiquinone oxidoreductase subunit F (NADH-binding)
MDVDSPETKYIVCNADEMEPGTFKDRLLMEGDGCRRLLSRDLSRWGL